MVMFRNNLTDLQVCERALRELPINSGKNGDIDSYVAYRKSLVEIIFHLRSEQAKSRVLSGAINNIKF